MTIVACKWMNRGIQTYVPISPSFPGYSNKLVHLLLLFFFSYFYHYFIFTCVIAVSAVVICRNLFHRPSLSCFIVFSSSSLQRSSKWYIYKRSGLRIKQEAVASVSKLRSVQLYVFSFIDLHRIHLFENIKFIY